jgi:peptidoglycan-N-acetylglucosamine deacetylase
LQLPAPITALRILSRWTPRQMFFSLPLSLRGRVALTFDDGPHPEVTPKILDVLAADGATATFFFQGVAANTYRELVRRAHTEGHLVAGHGMTHESARRQTTDQAVKNAVECHAMLQDILGAQLARLYRPPYGELTVGSLRALLGQGVKLAFWNYDSNDSFVSRSAEVLDRVRYVPPPDRGIMLFHDDYKITAEALPEVLRAVRTQGLEPISLGDSP